MKIVSTIIFLLLIYFSNDYSQNSTFDHSLFDRLLKKYVDENGLVDYNSFKNNDDFNKYLKSLAEANLNDYSDNVKLAFYINAYNAIVINNVVNHLPIDSPMDVKGFFNNDKFLLAGEEVTLNEIEYNKVFTIDPVLCHFGLVCAGKSCPILLQKAYTGSTVTKQLEKNAKVFLNDDNKNSLNRKNNTLYLSEIFKWFEDEFINKFGSLKETAAIFLNHTDSEYIRENEIAIKFLKYDWSLNKQ